MPYAAAFAHEAHDRLGVVLGPEDRPLAAGRLDLQLVRVGDLAVLHVLAAVAGVESVVDRKRDVAAFRVLGSHRRRGGFRSGAEAAAVHPDDGRSVRYRVAGRPEHVEPQVDGRPVHQIWCGCVLDVLRRRDLREHQIDVPLRPWRHAHDGRNRESAKSEE